MELEILENTKILLGIDSETDTGEHDALLKFLIDDIIGEIMKYCRIEVLPRQLYGIAAQMAAELFRSNIDGSDRAVKSITEGDRRVEFEGLSERFAGYAQRLKPFVNKSARLPSEMEARDEQS